MAKKSNSFIKSVIFVIILAISSVVTFSAFNIINVPSSYEIPGASIYTTSVKSEKIDVDIVKSADMSVHFLELGNKYTGDCSFIKIAQDGAEDIEILIDAGSKASSIPIIEDYIKQYIDGKLDYVIVTHAHQDHIAGFATSENTDSLFDKFEIGNIIDFGDNTNKTISNSLYKNYVTQRTQAINQYGANYKTADELKGTTINLTESVSMHILNHIYQDDDAYSETENNYSVCTLFTQTKGSTTYKYLFTGDLEKEGEESLITYSSAQTELLKNITVYKAGHHGSKTSSTPELLQLIKPQIICVCCCAGSSEYTTKTENQFPTQEFINNVSIYTSQIYVTSLCEDYKASKFTSFNGDIAVCTKFVEPNLQLSVYCSNDTKVLKDSDWFKTNRVLPSGAV